MTHLAVISLFHFIFLFANAIQVLCNDDEPKSLVVFRGIPPVVNGEISPGEYADATFFEGTGNWSSEINAVKSPADLSLKGWIKHDGTHLYMAFHVLDDVLYGVDIPRWLPDNDSSIHDFTLKSWPWFGDGLEIFLAAADDEYTGTGDRVTGNGYGWQIVCSSHKSYKHKLKAGGLLEGNPRNEEAWKTYQKWFSDSSMVAAVKSIQTATVRGYVIELKIAANPCLQIAKDTFWSPSLGTVSMKFNIELQDLDHPSQGNGNFGNYHHIELWSGSNHHKDLVSKWGTLILMPGFR